MSRPIDLAHGVWNSGNPNYPAGGNPWNGQPTGVWPAYNYFTPNTPAGAQDMNAILGGISQPYANLVNWVAPSATMTGPSDLTAITGMANNETRHIPGYGMFIYKSAGTATPDNVFVANGNGGVGRWYREDYYAMPGYLSAFEEYYATGAATLVDLSSYTPDAPDPMARAGGNQAKVVTASNIFTLHQNDLLDISYAVPFWMSGLVSNLSDVSIGVWVVPTSGAPGTFFIPSTVERRTNRSSIVTNAAASTNVDIHFARSIRHRMTTAEIPEGDYRFKLVAGCVTNKHGEILDGASLSVAVWRCPL